MKKILGACIGSCVHVAGIINFLDLSKKFGYSGSFIGSAVDIEDLAESVKKEKPDIVAISYRLSPESFDPLMEELKEKVYKKNKTIKFILGTTKPVAEKAKKFGIFDAIFTGEEKQEYVIGYLKNDFARLKDKRPPQKLIDRISFSKPYPLLRHHYGRPDIEQTLKGIKEISLSKAIDVLSIGPDQNTQEFFFHPAKMRSDQDGAGGVPVRSEQDFIRLYQASRRGNYPLMRCYSGTNDILRLAQVLKDTINNAWCAIPLCWYNQLDNRSSRSLEDSIKENQDVMKWHAERDIPVEVNESHHWSLRYAPDGVAVAAAFLAAYNAKKMGVTHYVSQYMFNTPPETNFTMDLAKMLAKIEMIESLHDSTFTSYRETRSGLYSFPADYAEGKGQLASSTFLQMQLDPDIVHVVAYCEADHAAKPKDIIESSKIVKRVIENYLKGFPDVKDDSKVIERKDELLRDCKSILKKIKELDGRGQCEDALSCPKIISEAIQKGILDAPHLKGLKIASGKVRTACIHGAIYSIDDTEHPISEEERIKNIE